MSAPGPRRELPEALLPRLRDVHQVEALLAHEQARYREQLAAWRASEAAVPAPPVPDSYREAVARLQIALARLAAEYELLPPGQG